MKKDEPNWNDEADWGELSEAVEYSFSLGIKIDKSSNQNYQVVDKPENRHRNASDNREAAGGHLITALEKWAGDRRAQKAFGEQVAGI